jgi:hypothetical protein
MTPIAIAWIATVLAIAPAKPAATKPAPSPKPATAAPSAPPSAASPAKTPTPAPAASPSPSPATGERTPPPAGADGPTAAAEPAAEVTRYQFTGLDISGELRTPALLQFLARIGGEFETVGIPHRSFMPELAQTAMEDAL